MRQRMDKYEIIKKIENFAPVENAESWDASGWIVETDKKGYQKTEVSVNKEANQTSDTAEGTIRMDGENTVDYTNTKTVPSPTGIALEILPFAVLFLAAIAGGVVFFRRKRG